MNTKFLIVRSIYEDSNISQRILAKKFCVSLGKINGIIKEAEADGYLSRVKGDGNGSYVVTIDGEKFIKEHKVDGALILACGMGVRIAPYTYDTPKSFITIKGEKMIERQIEQLKSVGINDITIMVGYLKEKFDYLIDKYGVKLIYNEEYKDKNTLATFYHAREVLRGKNMYICVSDVYITENIYHTYEIEPYYTGEFFDDCKNEWRYITNNKNEIKAVELGGKEDYCFIGSSFLTKEFLDEFIPLIEKYYAMSKTNNYYWEDVLVQNLKNLPTIYVYKLNKGIIYEFDNLSDIKSFNKDNEVFGTEVITFVTKALKVDEKDIKDIEMIKEGMTNHSYKFSINGEKYVARIPCEDVNEFINRKNEYEVYEALKNTGIIETLVFFDRNNGYKISKYFEDARPIDIQKENELADCMKIYKRLHKVNSKVSGSCDIIDKIDEHINIIKKNNINIPYDDFDEVILDARKIETMVIAIKRPKTICHGNVDPKNIVYTKDGIKLLGFEYAGMADPLSDIALFGFYVDFDIEKTLNLYKIYSEGDTVNKKIEKKLLVCYMALGGLYSALWAIVREALAGTDYGTYGMKNYRMFKKCFEYLQKEV